MLELVIFKISSNPGHSKVLCFDDPKPPIMVLLGCPSDQCSLQLQCQVTNTCWTMCCPGGAGRDGIRTGRAEIILGMVCRQEDRLHQLANDKQGVSGITEHSLRGTFIDLSYSEGAMLCTVMCCGVCSCPCKSACWVCLFSVLWSIGLSPACSSSLHHGTVLLNRCPVSDERDQTARFWSPAQTPFFNNFLSSHLFSRKKMMIN